MALTRYTVCVLCRRAAVGKRMSRAMCAAANPLSQVDFLKGEKHRKHPGVTNLKTVHLPNELQMAANSIINGAHMTRLADRTQSLSNFLWSRKRAVETSSLRQTAELLEKKIWEQAMEKRQDVDKELLEERIKRKVLSELRRTTYHWTPLKFDEELGLLYMAARLAGGYAAVRRALNEIKKRDPSFTPQTLLDFGSGLGTVAWASHSHWGNSLKEMVCVDSSPVMNNLAERLLKGDDNQAQPFIKHVYFRQFLPVSPKVQFDLVFAAFTLSEIPSLQEREEAVFTLWRKTQSYLVLVENGTREGHETLMEARDTLLKKQEKIVHDPRPASVFAPCPHELQCPKLASERITPCNFQQAYQPLTCVSRSNNHHIEKFSFLILSRNGPAMAETPGVDWARLIGPVLRRKRHVHCRMCYPDGQLQHHVVTTRRHSKDVYRCARSSDWGDQVPVIQKVDYTDQSDSE